jgi:hypothetical protein
MFGLKQIPDVVLGRMPAGSLRFKGDSLLPALVNASRRIFDSSARPRPMGGFPGPRKHPRNSGYDIRCELIGFEPCGYSRDLP